MKKLVYVLAFLIFCSAIGQNGQIIYKRAVQTSKMQKAASTPSLLPAPLDSNSNTELITGNAAAFPAGEVNGVSGITEVGPPEIVVSSELIDDGYVGDYVAKIDANGYNGGYGRAEHQGVSVTSSTTYEYVLLYRHSGTGSTGRFKVDGISTPVEVNGLSATTWTELSGTFTTGGSDTTAIFEIWCHRPFTSANGTEWLEYKLTVKEQD